MTSIAAILDDKGSVQGQVHHKGKSDDDSLNLSGSANAGETVRIYQNGTLIGETTADSTGQWQFTASQLSEGSYSFSARSLDSQGNESLPSSEYIVNVDQTAAVAKDLKIGDVNGQLQNGATINTGLVTLSGKAEANAQVNIYDNGQMIASVKADENGQWQADLDLAVGNHEVSTMVVDEAGNKSLDSTAINLDVEAPNQQAQQSSAQIQSSAGGPPEVILPPGTIIQNGGFTNDSTPVINGTATPGATVTLSVNNDTYGPVIADTNGQWQINIDKELPEGTAIFRAKAVNAFGENYSGYSLIIDTEAPDAPVITYGDDDVGIYQGDLHHPSVTDDDTITFHGTGTAGEFISLYDGTTFLGVTVVTGSGEWEFTATHSFIEGLHTIAAYAIDAAGNISDKSNEFEVIVDRTVEAPQITHLVDDQGSNTADVLHGEKTDDQLPLISGTAEAESQVTVSLDGQLLGTVTADALGNWSIQVTNVLDEGSHEVNATQLDRAGNQSGESLNFEFDVVLNAEPIAEDDVFTVIKSSQLNVLANDSDPDGDPLTLTRIVSQGNHGSARVNNAGKLIYTPDGNNTQTVNDTLVYEISDGKGGFDTATVNIEVLAPLIKPTIDLLASSDSGKYNFDDLTNDTTPTFTGSATAGSTVVLYADNAKIGEALADSNGIWTITSTHLADKVYDFHVESSLANSSKQSNDLSVTIDTIVEASASLPSAQENGSWFGRASSVRFQISADESVEYHIKDVDFHWGSRVWYNPGTSITATGSTSSDVTVAARYTSNYSHGWFTFNAKFTDLAGNELDMDLTPVVVDPITSLADGGYLVTYLKLSDTDEQGFDVFAQRYDAQGNKAGDSFMVNSFKPNDQINSDVIGLKDGGYVITWQSRDQDGDLNGIYAQRYNSDNETVGAETQINVYTESDQQNPAISDLANGGYVITWMSQGQDGSGEGVYMRLFDATGTAITGDIRVNDSTIDHQANPSITTLEDGRFIVSWESADGNGQNQALAKIYDSVGRTLSSEFNLSNDAGIQSQTHVSATADGGFAVSWLSEGDNESNVMVQLYDANGNARLSQGINVHTSVSAGASKPEVAGLNNGDIVITWTADDGDQLGVFASRYNADGEIVFENRLINTQESGIQTEPHIVALEDGGYLITWGDLQTDEARSSVWGQQFNAQNEANGPIFEVGEVANYGEVETTASNTDESSAEEYAADSNDEATTPVEITETDHSNSGTVTANNGDSNPILPPEDNDLMLVANDIALDSQDDLTVLAASVDSSPLADFEALSSIDFSDLLIDASLLQDNGSILSNASRPEEGAQSLDAFYQPTMDIFDILNQAISHQNVDII